MVGKKCFAMFCQNCQFFGCTPRLKETSDQNIHQNAPNCTIFPNFLGGTCPRAPLPCTACSVATCMYTLPEKLSARLC